MIYEDMGVAHNSPAGVLPFTGASHFGPIPIFEPHPYESGGRGPEAGTDVLVLSEGPARKGLVRAFGRKHVASA